MSGTLRLTYLAYCRPSLMRTCKLLSLSYFLDPSSCNDKNYRILVLKDGQIIEQGNHKQLLKLDGVFAAMWADQINAAGGPPVDEGPKEAVTGYHIEDAVPFTDEPVTADIDTAPTQDTAEPLAEASEAPVEETAPGEDTDLGGTRPDGPAAAVVAETQVDDAPVAFPSSDVGIVPVSDTTPPQVNPVALPTSDAALVAFPGSTSDESASQKAPSTTQNPGVMFAPEVGTPERTATPDPESDTKRKRISSQNFQRLARRISITTRRSGSISGLPIPILGNFRRDSTSASSSSAPAQVSTEGDAGAKASSESPAPSIQSDSDKDKAKKDKKKRRFL